MRSGEVRVSDLLLIEALLLLAPVLFAALLLKSQAFVLFLNLLHLSGALSSHLVLEHAGRDPVAQRRRVDAVLGEPDLFVAVAMTADPGFEVDPEQIT